MAKLLFSVFGIILLYYNRMLLIFQ